MAVLEHAEDSFASAFFGSVVRAVANFALTGVIVAPLFIGAGLGYFVTERLDDPEAMAIQANLPALGSEPRAQSSTRVDG